MSPPAGTLFSDDLRGPQARRFGAFNGRGFWTLYLRGVQRYLRYGLEVIAGPLISSMLFLAVFVLALGGETEMVPGLGLGAFVAPGIVMFSLATGAFQMAATPIIFDKMEGMIGDILMAPLSAWETAAAYALAAATGSLLTGMLIIGVMAFFVDFSMTSLAAVVGYGISGALLFGLLGTIVGLWAERWDHYTAVETFLVLPLGLLSGTFYTIDRLPEAGHWLLLLNPVFYAINGLRFGLTGYTDVSLLTGSVILVLLNLVLAIVAWRLFAIGYKVKP